MREWHNQVANHHYNPDHASADYPYSYYSSTTAAQLPLDAAGTHYLVTADESASRAPGAGSTSCRLQRFSAHHLESN